MTRDDDNVVHIDFRRAPAKSEAAARDKAAIEESAGKGSDSAESFSPDGVNGLSLGGDGAKLAAFEEMLDHGLVLVALDPRADGVDVPELFRSAPQIHLSFSHRFNVDDFEFDASGVRGTLSFDEGPYLCVVPWGAVYGLMSDAMPKRIVFPGSFPPELLALIPPGDESGDD